MGCDGGTIPRRDELVRLKKKPEQKDKEAELAFKWRSCALSQQPLQEPIVSCGLGRLYSKSSILEALIDKANKPESIIHIKNLKDIRDLNLTKNPAFVNADRNDAMVDDRNAPYICPIIGIEMSGKFRFIFLWSCGCVFSERALKEIKTNVCHKCQKPFSTNDVVILNGDEKDLILMQQNLVERVASRKKKIKTETVTTLETEIKIENGTETSTAKNDIDPQPGGSGTQNKSTKNDDDVPRLGLPKLKPKSEARGHFGAQKRAHGAELVQDPSYKNTKKDYSVASDPKSSEVYKSIFTSHKSEKDQKRAHWVTYNPFYN